MLTIILIVSFIAAYLMLIWFKKDAIVEYRWLYPDWLYRRLRIEEYLEVSADDVRSSYPKFLLQYGSQGFFHRLINCEICLSIWITLFLSIIAFVGLGFVTHVWPVLLYIVPCTFASAYVSLLLYHLLLRMMSNVDAERRP